MSDLSALIEQYIEQEKLPSGYLDAALKWFTPLCESISLHHDESAHATSDQKRPLFIGVNGCQGSGKSTLSGLLHYLLIEHYHKSTVVFSLDDFYLRKAQRITLGNQVHPLLSTRGVPGTHDVSLMKSVLEALSFGQAVQIPSFDKSIDDRCPVAQWQNIETQIDIVIVEGWCWGTTAQSKSELEQAINDFEREHDSDSTWRTYVNTSLSTNYEPLYQYIDQWVFLKAPSFDAVYAWRLQQEQKLRERVGNASNVMSNAEILNFIQYYQRLTVHTLCTLDKDADWIFELDNERNITKSRQHAK